MDLHVSFREGTRFPCPKCGGSHPVHDCLERTWRHLNLFQHKTYLHARVPRTECPEHGVHQIAVPWGEERSGFTLLFEAFVMERVPLLPCNLESHPPTEKTTLSTLLASGNTRKTQRGLCPETVPSGVLRQDPALGGRVTEALVLARQPQPPGTGQKAGPNHQEPLGGGPQPHPNRDRQRHPGGTQQPLQGRLGESPRLPHLHLCGSELFTGQR